MNTLLHASTKVCSAALTLSLALCTTARASPAEPTVAADLRTGAELVDACQQKAADMAAPDGRDLCDGFLLGYLQAHPEIGFRDQMPSEYMQRVMRTRAPTHPETTSLKRLTYCLDNAGSMADIRRKIAQQDPERAAMTTPAGVVERVLEQDYRCSP